MAQFIGCREMSDRRAFLQAIGVVGLLSHSGCTQMRSQDRVANDGGKITVTPSDSLLDERLSIELTELEPSEEITVWAQINDDNNQTWLSYGRFVTNEDGTVNLAEEAPLSGTYEGVDSMGLLWSMRVKNVPRVPFLEDESFIVRFAIQRESTVIDTTEITRRFIATDVTHHRVEEEGVVGVFFEPPGTEQHPGVVALHGSEGDIPWNVGAMLASRGYATLALQYFSPTGEGNLPTDLVGVPLEYCDRAIDWLLDQPAVRDGQVGVVGESKGGELALVLGSHSSEVGAVVGYVPSGVVWQGMEGNGMVAEGSSWTVNGNDLEFVPLRFGGSLRELIDYGVSMIRGRPMSIEWMYRESLQGVKLDRREAATIPVEQIDGPVLLLSGEKDELWPSSLLSDIVIHRLNKHDHPYSYNHIPYEDAGHFITVPYQPTSHFDAWESLKLGGTPSGNARAAADSWPLVLETLSEGLQ